MAQGPAASGAGSSHWQPQIPSQQSASGSGQIYNYPQVQASDEAERAQTQSQAYLHYSGAGGTNAWPYPYSSGQSYYNQYTPYYTQHAWPSTWRSESKPKVPSPSPPPPEFHDEWDNVLKTFLERSGLIQALHGMEADILVMNPEWERQNIPSALSDLLQDLTRLVGRSENEESIGRSLDERKLDYVHLDNGRETRSQTSINKSISLFLAKNRARNDVSNRNEFLQSIAEKRRRLEESEGMDTVISSRAPSCARTDAKPLDRDLQMKYDIARNEEGPLRKTVKMDLPQDRAEPNEKHKRSVGVKSQDHLHLTSERHPALDERLKNIETHLSVRYVPSTPYSLLDRLKFLEDHIVRLEREYPPWAALHFNQPNRGWPPPPRPTPIIVPPRLTRKDPDPLSVPAVAQTTSIQHSTSAKGKSKASGSSHKRGKDSSLHKAVMERLEVQKALNDLAGA